MLKQIRLDISPHRVKDKVHALPSGKLGSGDKITVTGNQNDLINLLLRSCTNNQKCGIMWL